MGRLEIKVRNSRKMVQVNMREIVHRCGYERTVVSYERIKYGDSVYLGSRKKNEWGWTGVRARNGG